MAKLTMFDGLELPATADFHVHLRDGAMMEAVTPTIRKGGVDTVFVMPNLVPPITTVSHALDYQSRLQKLAPDVTFLMSLYLHPSITPETVHEAKRAGIAGIKSYPAGVTTNSSSGVVDYESFYPVFAAMEEVDLVLNLHGESPPSSSSNTEPGREIITVLNAEESFLPTLLSLHRRFPKLRIVLEHCTTAAALQAVRTCGPNVVGTITAHHMFLTVDDWAGDPLNFCKPVAKLPSDRAALVKAAVGGEPKFFLGTDSAPHLLSAKKGLTAGGMGTGKCAAGVFTQGFATQFVLEALETAVETGVLENTQVTETVLKNFLGGVGRKFYGVQPSEEKILVSRNEEVVTDVLVKTGVESGQQERIVQFRSGKPVYSLKWV